MKPKTVFAGEMRLLNTLCDLAKIVFLNDHQRFEVFLKENGIFINEKTNEYEFYEE